MHSTNIFIFFIISLPSVTWTSCADRKSCCSSTFTNDMCRQDDEKTSCNCDVACRLRGDCCNDYQEFCLAGAPVDCRYKPWEQWTPCSTAKACDVGFQTRRRGVIYTGNFRSENGCAYSSMSETRRCGDLSCYTYTMNRVHDVSQYVRDHFRFTSAIYAYVGHTSDNCDIPKSTYICVMCSDDSKCGNSVVSEGEMLEIKNDSCHGTWVKRTSSALDVPCSSATFFAEPYAFN